MYYRNDLNSKIRLKSIIDITFLLIFAVIYVVFKNYITPNINDSKIFLSLLFFYILQYFISNYLLNKDINLYIGSAINDKIKKIQELNKKCYEMIELNHKLLERFILTLKNIKNISINTRMNTKNAIEKTHKMWYHKTKTGHLGEATEGNHDTQRRCRTYYLQKRRKRIYRSRVTNTRPNNCYRWDHAVDCRRRTNRGRRKLYNT